jgi:hypothetical protein
VKRIAALATVLVVALSCLSASAATPLSRQLVDFGAHSGWTPYVIGRAETGSCPESTFARLASPSSAGAVYENRSLETLFLEKVETSSHPVRTYDALLAHMTTCKKEAANFDGQITFPRTRTISLAHMSVAVKAYSVTFVDQGAHVSAVVAYARKGPVALAVAEIILTQLNAKHFTTLLRRAIAKAG